MGPCLPRPQLAQRELKELECLRGCSTKMEGLSNVPFPFRPSRGPAGPPQSLQLAKIRPQLELRLLQRPRHVP